MDMIRIILGELYHPKQKPKLKDEKPIGIAKTPIPKKLFQQN
jgi:hypothetical protein